MERVESARARRRRLAETISRRRLSSYIHIILGGDSTAPHMPQHHWVKSGICCCNCRKRKHGAPRQDMGLCHCEARERIYRWRSLSLDINRRVLRGEDPYEVA